MPQDEDMAGAEQDNQPAGTGDGNPAPSKIKIGDKEYDPSEVATKLKNYEAFERKIGEQGNRLGATMKEVEALRQRAERAEQMAKEIEGLSNNPEVKGDFEKLVLRARQGIKPDTGIPELDGQIIETAKLRNEMLQLRNEITKERASKTAEQYTAKVGDEFQEIVDAESAEGGLLHGKTDDEISDWLVELHKEAVDRGYSSPKDFYRLKHDDHVTERRFKKLREDELKKTREKDRLSALHGGGGGDRPAPNASKKNESPDETIDSAIAMLSQAQRAARKVSRAA